MGPFLSRLRWVQAAMLRLRDELRLELVHDERAPLGSGVAGSADARLRECCVAITDYRRGHGLAATVANAAALLEAAFAGPLAPLYAAPDRLHPAVLHPDPALTSPVALRAAGDGVTPSTIALPPGAAGELARWLGEFQRGALRPASATGAALFDALEACGAFEVAHGPVSAPPPTGEFTFIGHACVLASARARVLVDPFLMSPSSAWPASYQPWRLSHLAGAEAVLVTHSHPDHYDPGTLLRLGAETPIHVPAVGRESLLAVDMASRLRALGFSRVIETRPGDRFAAGDIEVAAWPLPGEQPTTGEVLHPEVRNVGLSWHLRAAGVGAWLIADAGRDATGDVRDIAAAVRRAHADGGGTSLVFGGYRGFPLYPVQYLFSSVSRYLLFVPPGERTVRQKIMNDADDLLDTAERAGAARVVPYAAGGAPWFWERGLGERPRGRERGSLDHPPEHVAEVAAARSRTAEGPIASPLQVTVLRPGESLRVRDAVAANGEATILRGPLQQWPYDPPRWHQVTLALAQEAGSQRASGRRLLLALGPALAQWREQRLVDGCFLMRKPPGVRLRALGPAALPVEWARWCAQLVDDGVLAAWYPQVYEPETARFGGDAAMHAVHAWADVDSTQLLALARMREGNDWALAPASLCEIVAADLLEAALYDRAETWAVWRAHAQELDIAVASGLAPSAGAGDDRHPAAPCDESGPNLPSHAEQAVIAVYRESNRRLAGALARISERGELTAGLRSVLLAVLLFHFNRHGLAAPVQRALCERQAARVAPPDSGAMCDDR
jgi:thiopeptide-type bacteriocin biosynthesis protein